MKQSSAVRLSAYLIVGAAVVIAAPPASAQFEPRPLSDPAIGEKYHIEAAVDLWSPAANISASSEEFGIVGSTIDLKKDLGVQDATFGAFKITGRPARKHKLRFELIPIRLEARSTLTRTLIFNGQRYDPGLPVNSSFEWKAYRFAYQYDALSRDRWFVGFIGEIKYTDIQIDLQSPLLNEFARARAPIPALGGIGRFYVLPNTAITFEMTGFRLPENLVQDTYGHYADWDLSGMYNFTNSSGVQGGVRSLDVGYAVDADKGTMKLQGIYFGFVARY